MAGVMRAHHEFHGPGFAFGWEDTVAVTAIRVHFGLKNDEERFDITVVHNRDFLCLEAFAGDAQVPFFEILIRRLAVETPFQ